MTTPKEALRVAKAYFRAEWLKPGSDEPEKNLYAMIRDAMPVAELEHQAMELLREINPYLTEETYRKIIDILTQLEALK